MSHQSNADMMHDALRADVMSALYATTPAQRQTFAVDEVTGHAKDLLGNYDGAAAEAPEMTAGTAEAIARITEIITQIHDGQRTIAAAVEEQSATTDLMSRNVSDVSAAAGEISATVSHITSSTEATAEGANTTRQSAERVSSAAGEIQTLIGEFRY